jgi:hypothetical protein
MLGIIDLDVHRAKRDALGDAGHDLSTYRTKGLYADNRIATSKGWKRASEIAVGDLVLTFDNGMQPVVAVTRTAVLAGRHLPEAALPVHVPAGALGNQTEMELAPGQPVMVESDAAERLFGDPFAVLKARDLVGFAGIGRSESPMVSEVVTIHFAQDEVLHVDGGALVVAPSDVPGETTLAFLSPTEGPEPYTTYAGEDARRLVAAMTRDAALQGEGGPMRSAA